MLSEAATAVVSTPISILMWTPAQVAERDRVTKQAVTKKVREYADKGLTVERDGQGRIVRFNIAEYDHLRGKIGDPSKDQRKAASVETEVAADAGRPLVDKESYDEALRKKTWTEAARAQLRLDEEMGVLVRKDRFDAAIMACAEEIVRPIDGIAAHADELALAVERGGTHALRIELKKLALAVRKQIAKALADLGDGAPLIEPDDGPQA